MKLDISCVCSDVTVPGKRPEPLSQTTTAGLGKCKLRTRRRNLKELLLDSPMKLLRLTIQPPSDSSQNDFENTSAAQSRPALSKKRHRVNDIPHIAVIGNISQIIVQFLQVLGRLGIAADLEELHPDLPRGRFEPVELLRGLNQRALDVVCWDAICDADYVDGFGGLGLCLVVC